MGYLCPGVGTNLLDKLVRLGAKIVLRVCLKGLIHDAVAHDYLDHHGNVVKVSFTIKLKLIIWCSSQQLLLEAFVHPTIDRLKRDVPGCLQSFCTRTSHLRQLEDASVVCANLTVCQAIRPRANKPRQQEVLVY